MKDKKIELKIIIYTNQKLRIKLKTHKTLKKMIKNIQIKTKKLNLKYQ